MTKHTFKVSKRTISGRKVKSLRNKGLSPANIFGSKITSQNISLEIKPFLKLYSEVGESTLIYLEIEGEKEPRPVFIRDVILHPVSGNLLHVIFNQVNLKVKVSAPVPVKLMGEPPAEKEKVGILVQQLDELNIKALPTDMPENFEIDVSKLAAVGDNIKVSDLKLDSRLEIETEPETIIVQIEALAKEEVAPTPTVAEGLPSEAEAKEGETTPATESSAKPEEKTPEKDKKE